MTIDLAPRALLESERRVLDRLLSVEFLGAEALRVQAGMTLGQRTCRCGCASVDLVVGPSAPRAGTTGTVPVEAQAEFAGPIGPIVILLFVLEGRLSLMEIASYGDHVPDRWPDAATLIIEPR